MKDTIETIAARAWQNLLTQHNGSIDMARNAAVFPVLSAVDHAALKKAFHAALFDQAFPEAKRRFAA